MKTLVLEIKSGNSIHLRVVHIAPETERIRVDLSTETAHAFLMTPEEMLAYEAGALATEATGGAM